VCEAIPQPAAERNGGASLGSHRIAENVAHFFFHTVAVTIRPTLESSLDAFFEISNDELSHDGDIMISLWQRPFKFP